MTKNNGNEVSLSLSQLDSFDSIPCVKISIRFNVKPRGSSTVSSDLETCMSLAMCTATLVYGWMSDNLCSLVQEGTDCGTLTLSLRLFIGMVRDDGAG